MLMVNCKFIPLSHAKKYSQKNIWIIPIVTITLQYTTHQYSRCGECIWTLTYRIPHQSRLGNSSNFYEIPRLSLGRPMAGPIPFGEALSSGGLQRSASTQILSFGVSSHPLMWLLYEPRKFVSRLYLLWPMNSFWPIRENVVTLAFSRGR